LCNQIYIRPDSDWKVIDSGVMQISSELQLVGGGGRAQGPLAVRSMAWTKLAQMRRGDLPAVYVMCAHITGGRFEDQYFVQQLAEERFYQVERMCDTFFRTKRPSPEDDDIGILVGDFNATTEYVPNGPMSGYFKAGIASSEGVKADAEASGKLDLEEQFKKYMLSPFEAIKKHGWSLAYGPELGITSGFGHLIDHMALNRKVDCSAKVQFLTNQKFGKGPPDTNLVLTDHNSVKSTFTIAGSKQLDSSVEEYRQRSRCAALVKRDFQQADQRGSGTLTKHELKGLLRTLLPKTAASDIENFISNQTFDEADQTPYSDFIDYLFGLGDRFCEDADVCLGAAMQLPLLERVVTVLTQGGVRLLSATWLLAQGDDYIVQRRQDLPEEAFVPLSQVVSLWEDNLKAASNLVVISYGWLSARHPDPAGFHMKTVKKYLRMHMSYHKDALGSSTLVGIFWDYASLPQDGDCITKTPQEKAIFNLGVSAVSELYGNSNTIVVQLTRMPQGADGGGLAPFADRGWCWFEATVASIRKAENRLLDLGIAGAAQTLDDDTSTWSTLMETAIASRQPPLVPEEMRRSLAAKRFTKSIDMELVAEKYKEFFSASASAGGKLDFGNHTKGEGWSDEHMIQLTQALPHFTKCNALNLERHHLMSEQSLAALMGILSQMPALERIELPGHSRKLGQLDQSSAGKAFVDAWKGMGKKHDPANSIGVLWGNSSLA
jgi:hypothetical protein